MHGICHLVIRMVSKNQRLTKASKERQAQNRKQRSLQHKQQQQLIAEATEALLDLGQKPDQEARAAGPAARPDQPWQSPPALPFLVTHASAHGPSTSHALLGAPPPRPFAATTCGAASGLMPHSVVAAASSPGVDAGDI